MVGILIKPSYVPKDSAWKRKFNFFGVGENNQHFGQLFPETFCPSSGSGSKWPDVPQPWERSSFPSAEELLSMVSSQDDTKGQR